MFQRAWIHLGARGEAEAAQIAGCIQRFATVRIVYDSEIPATLPAERFAGAVFALGETDAAIASLIALRRAAPSVAVLALLPAFRPRALDALQVEGVEVATLDARPASLVAFVQRALASHFAGTPRVGEVVRQLAADRHLTPRELQLLTYALGDESRARIRRRLGISENTLKTEVRGLIRKCGARNADALAKQVLRRALGLAAVRDDAVSASAFAAGAHPAARMPRAANDSELGAPLSALSTSPSSARPYGGLAWG